MMQMTFSSRGTFMLDKLFRLERSEYRYTDSLHIRLAGGYRTGRPRSRNETAAGVTQLTLLEKRGTKTIL